MNHLENFKLLWLDLDDSFELSNKIKNLEVKELYIFNRIDEDEDFDENYTYEPNSFII